MYKEGYNSAIAPVWKYPHDIALTVLPFNFVSFVGFSTSRSLSPSPN